MFDSRKQEYTIESLQLVADAANYRTTTYVSEGTAKIYIILQDRTLTRSNDLDLYEATLVGYTDDTRIDKNWRIGGEYIVTSVIPHRAERILYLKRYTNGK